MTETEIIAVFSWAVAAVACAISAILWSSQRALRKEFDELVRHLRRRGVNMDGLLTNVLVDDASVRLATAGAVEYAEKRADAAAEEVRELNARLAAPLILRPAVKVEAYRRPQHV